jgi:antitoxin component YwqK of YwqJK toxin-antitoxin module
MLLNRYLFIVAIILSGNLCLAQEKINQYDDDGKRHGVWKKYYENSDQLRYEGTFEHGKEIGVFKFYCGDCEDNPTVIRTFNVNDRSAHVQFFTVKGKLVSEGKMIGKDRIGKWVYYHKSSDKVMTLEIYNNGKLDGKKVTYYTNDQITEETEYKNGLKNGMNNFYSPEGIQIKKLIYKNGLLHGPAYYFDSNGSLILEGNYKNGKKNGLWKHYEDGALIKEETFPKSH